MSGCDQNTLGLWNSQRINKHFFNARNKIGYFVWLIKKQAMNRVA